MGGPRRRPSEQAAQYPDRPQGELRKRHVTAAGLSVCSTPEARSILPMERALELRLLPIRLDRSGARATLELAGDTECSAEQLRAIRFIAGTEVRVLTLSCEDLRRAILLAYHGDESRLSAAVDRLQRPNDSGRAVSDRILDALRTRPGETGDFIATLLEYAHAHEISDLHLTPVESGFVLRVRQDGELRMHEAVIGDRQLHLQCISRIKVLASMDPTRQHLPADGAFRFSVGEQYVAVRVATVPTVFGERAVLRILRGGSPRTLVELGWDRREIALLDEALVPAEGAVIVCGPTGSGKSSSLYGILGALVARGLSVMSAEDPVEALVPGVAQSEVRTERGVGFPELLRAFLRSDPDVIMVGETRDAQSARLAVQAATTGHLVLTSLHCADAAGCRARLRVLGVEEEEFRQVIRLVVSQRLLPRICSACGAPDLLGSNELKVPLFRGTGCGLCAGTGRKGRVPIVELVGWAPEHAGTDGGAPTTAERLWSFSDSVRRRLLSGTVSLEDGRPWLVSEQPAP